MKRVNHQERARDYVRNRFPSLKDIEPTHTTRGCGENTLHVYTFKGVFTVSGGTISRVVRVFVNKEGEIVKAISSK